MSVETSTPKARAFFGALLGSADLRGVDYSLTSRELRAIVSAAIKAELYRRMHSPPALVGEWLHKVTLGYYQYHAVPGACASSRSSHGAYVDYGGQS